MCDDDFDDGSSYLAVDYSVSCDTDTYKLMYAYAVICVFLIPIGVPAMYAVLLGQRRHLVNPKGVRSKEEARAVREEPENKDRIAHLEFLYGLYWPQFYMMEVWECARRLLLTGLPVLYLRGTASQCASGMLVCFSAVIGLVATQPCVDRTNTLILAAANGAQVSVQTPNKFRTRSAHAPNPLRTRSAQRSTFCSSRDCSWSLGRPMRTSTTSTRSVS